MTVIHSEKGAGLVGKRAMSMETGKEANLRSMQIKKAAVSPPAARLSHHKIVKSRKNLNIQT